MEEYMKFIVALQETFKSFTVEAMSGSKNQAAALRARKLSMELRTSLKDFRAISVENDVANREAKKA